MSIVQGFVEAVYENPSKYTFPNGKPKPSMWAMRVDNVRYSLKNTKPPAEGTYVQFEASQDEKGYWNAEGTTLKPATPPTAQVAQPVREVTVVGNPVVQAQPVKAYADPRQDSIIYQSSRKDAVEIVKLLLSKDLIDFGKAKKAQAMEMVEVYLDHYTVRFMEDVKRLAPPEHDPLNAEAPEAAQALARPAKKAAAPKDRYAEAEQGEDEWPEDKIPF